MTTTVAILGGGVCLPLWPDVHPLWVDTQPFWPDTPCDQTPTPEEGDPPQEGAQKGDPTGRRTPPPAIMDRMTDACEIITFPHTSHAIKYG